MNRSQSFFCAQNPVTVWAQMAVKRANHGTIAYQAAEPEAW